MMDQQRTLPTPLATLPGCARHVLALTIVWHPERTRVGDQHIATTPDAALELSRFAPLFWRADGDGAPLTHSGIARSPLRIVPDGDGGVHIFLPDSKMLVELDSVALSQTARLDASHLARGPMLTLGRAIIVCLHRMHTLPALHRISELIGVGSAAIDLRAQIHLVAPTDTPVLLLGPTGSGKEVAARALHALSKRRDSALVAVNMAALNESLAAADLFGAAKGAYTGAREARRGWFDEADGATIFLDEIGNAPASVQPMLLRVLEGGHYRPLGAARDHHSSARVIAATDQDLHASGFNQALLHRLDAFVITLPALRERREDIGVLIVHALDEAGWSGTLPFDFAAQLALADWPGNIRQLVHVVRRAVLQLRSGATPHWPQPAAAAAEPAAPSARKKPSALTEQDVFGAMAAHGWAIGATAQALGISRPSLYKLLGENNLIRRPEDIPGADIAATLAACGNDLQRCAARLHTPLESLRRHVRRQDRAE